MGSPGEALPGKPPPAKAAAMALRVLEESVAGYILLGEDGCPVWANAAMRTRWPGLISGISDGTVLLPGRPSARAGAAAPVAPWRSAGDVADAEEMSLRAERVWTGGAPRREGYLHSWHEPSALARRCAHLEEALDELRRLDRARSERLSNLTHELRTPLNAVLGYSDLLLDDMYGELNGTQRETVGYLRDAADGLLSLINDLLSASRMEAGRADLVLDRFQIDHLVEGVLGQLRPIYEKKGLEARVEIDAASLLMRSDRDKCRRILVNLVGNAIKFTDEGSIRVHIGSGGDGPDCVVLSITDSGIGIPYDQQDQIFEMFHQADGGASREREGSGLGLYITRCIVELLGGTVRVDSEPGRGSTFTVTLPREIDDATAIRRLGGFERMAGPANAVGDDRPLVLLVGSTGDEGRILGTLLSAEDIRIEEVETPGDAIRRARRATPATIVLDIQAHPETAWVAFHELRDDPATADVPLVFLTDSTDADVHGSSTVATLHEPLDRRQVARAIRRTGVRGSIPELLVVDDEEAIRFAVSQLLRDEGYRVEEARSGNEALRRVRAQRPDLILLDLGLPDISGWEVIRILSADADHAGIPILILSGTALSTQEVEKVNRIAGGYLPKEQFRIDQLVDQVERVLGTTTTETAPAHVEPVGASLAPRDESGHGHVAARLAGADEDGDKNG